MKLNDEQLVQVAATLASGVACGREQNAAESVSTFQSVLRELERRQADAEIDAALEN